MKRDVTVLFPALRRPQKKYDKQDEYHHQMYGEHVEECNVIL